MLEIKDLKASYNQVNVLYGVTLNVQAGEILCVMGRNGAGKTTLLKSVMGIVEPDSGNITMDGETLNSLPPHEIPKRGIGYIPQGRRLFSELTVDENIEIGLMTREVSADTRDWVLDLFPRLKERLDQQAGTLSGGEQQMLAIARALSREVKLLLLDEPYEGLAPVVRHDIERALIEVKSEGITTILVEQNAVAALKLADTALILDTGEIVFRGTAQEVLDNEELRHEYLAI